MRTYEIQWRNGERQIVKGKRIRKALKAAGMEPQALRAAVDWRRVDRGSVVELPKVPEFEVW